MKRAIALTVLLLAAVGTASADTIKVTFVDGQGVRYSLNSGANFTATTAGQVRLQLNPTAGPLFWGFCADLLHYYGDGTTVQLESPGLDRMSNWNIPPYGGSPSAAGIRAAYLFRQFNGHTDLATNEAAALQVAIWEALFETGGSYNLGTGTARFQANGADVSVFTRAQEMLDGGFGPADAIWVRTVNNTDNSYHQDFMIPEPGALLMLGAGLLGVATAVRRRR